MSSPDHSLTPIVVDRELGAWSARYGDGFKFFDPCRDAAIAQCVANAQTQLGRKLDTATPIVGPGPAGPLAAISDLMRRFIRCTR